MYLPKKDIYALLSTLPYTVMQAGSNVFNALPVITFRLAENKVNLDLDNEILYQDITVLIDLWAGDSVTASEMLSEVEQLMRERGYLLAFSSDIPNAEKDVWHISTRFEN